MAGYGALPLYFEANRGQVDSQVRFLGRRAAHALFLTTADAGLILSPGAGADSKGNALRLRFIGANANPRVVGREELPGKVHYFLGNDPGKWRTNIPTYARVEYRDVYPGINLVYYGDEQQLEYDLVVAPGADPNTISLGFEGTTGLGIDAKGDLVLQTRNGELHMRRPFVYQELGGRRVPLDGNFVLSEQRCDSRDCTVSRVVVGVKVGSYDVRQPLVIDPVLSYSTYLGGSGGDFGSTLGVDAAGNAYVAGHTTSSDLPTTPGAPDATLGGLMDGFVAKLDATGSALVYCTYLGGSSDDWVSGIAVDRAGNAYLTGTAISADFPTTPGAFDTTFNGPPGGDAFVTKLNPTGTLLYSTYLGGNNSDNGSGIALDGAGNAYVTGNAGSTNFPTTLGAFDRIGGGDAFVTKLNSSGSALVYSTYLGGTGGEGGSGIAVDAAGNVYVTGATSSADFPTTPGAFDLSLGFASDAFVTKINPTGSGLVYSTYLGGTETFLGADSTSAIAIDAAGNAYVVGVTTATNFPTTPGAFDTSPNGGVDTYLTKLSPTGSALVYSTFLGGSNSDSPSGIAVDSVGNAYVVGEVRSVDFPTTSDAFDTTLGGVIDAFVAKFNSTASALVFSTYLGGSGSDQGLAIALDALPTPGVYVAGSTLSTDFPITPGAFDTTVNGAIDAFVAKITEAVPPPCPIETALRGTRDEAAMLNTLSRFRDDVLARSRAGRRYIRLFYRHAWEGTQLLTRHRALRREARVVLRRLTPNIGAILRGHWDEPAPQDVQAVENLLEAVAAEASPALQDAISQLRAEIRARTMSELLRD
jgi:hypothetical protein